MVALECSIHGCKHNFGNKCTLQSGPRIGVIVVVSPGFAGQYVGCTSLKYIDKEELQKEGKIQ